ncbi:MAG TPA: hypothetical protein VFQ88_05250 [Nevskiaceae bacterium]|nr:hypothetical protein [Nevskiaceae bacterium]
MPANQTALDSLAARLRVERSGLASFEQLPADQQRSLDQAVEQVQVRQRRDLDAAIQNALRHVPLLLRGPVLKILRS